MNILVVDDEKNIAYAIAQILEFKIIIQNNKCDKIT